MPTSVSRKRIEIPEHLWHLLNKAAAEEDLGVSTLAGLWLMDQLKQRRPGWHIRDPYRDENGPRPRRADAPAPAPDRER